jgi:hypothetical protein
MNRLITTTVDSQVSRVYGYNQRGHLLQADVDGLLTTFSYDGDGNRLLMSVAGVVTTYTLDYGHNRQILLEQGGAFATTKHYLYGLECIGEQVDADEPETEEWRYYHRDGNNLVRQTTNSQAEITLAWAYSPDGAVLFGDKGPVTNLGCGDIYDWSTGLIYKDGRYFDPNLGIWLALAPLVIGGGWFVRGKRGRRKEDDKRYLVLLLLLGTLVVAGCEQPTPPQIDEVAESSKDCTPTPTGTPAPLPDPTANPTATEPSIPTAVPTSTASPWTPTPTATQSPPPIPSIDALVLANPFGAGKLFLVTTDYGETRWGGQDYLAPGQGIGHPGVDLVPLDYALASRTNEYVAVQSHRDLFSPVSGRINRDLYTVSDEGNPYITAIIVTTLAGDVTVRLVHVDPREGPATDTIVRAGQPLGMNFKGRGYGPGSETPHLHLDIFTGSSPNRVYKDPLSMLHPSDDNLGSYWTYRHPDAPDNTAFTALPSGN